MKLGLISYLKQPYPYNENDGGYWKVIITFTTFVFLFLIIFKPFGIDRLELLPRVKAASIFGATTFVMLTINWALNRAFPSIFNEKDWTLGKELLAASWNFFSIGSANYLAAIWMFGDEGGFNKDGFWYAQFYTLTVGFFPYMAFLFINQIRLLKQNRDGSAELNEQLHKPATENRDMVTLNGEGNQDKLEIEAKKIIYIQSDGNYLEVMYFEEGIVIKKQIRCTISAMVTQLESYSAFFQCHRAFIINGVNLEEVKGNSQGYRCKMTGVDETIPVARSRNKAFKDFVS